MEQLLGFIVLTSPLFLIVLWLPACIFIAVWTSRKLIRTNLPGKVLSGILVFSLVFILPFIDEIVGRIYFNHLCANTPKTVVYKTVELPSLYWHENGKPVFITDRGHVDMSLLPSQYQWERSYEPYIDSIIKINKWRSRLIDIKSNTVLGEKISFMRLYGWINNFSISPSVGEGCNSLDKAERQQFILSIFKQQTSGKE